jgi:bacteriorhodopsin
MDVLHFDGKPIKYLRYVEWSICSTLMLLEMMISSKLSPTQMTPLLVLTLSFCVCGTIAALSVLLWVKLLMAVQGTFYCVIVILRMWRVTLEKSTQKDIDIDVAILNLLMASAIWPMFVLTWGLGPDVFGVITDVQETLAELIASMVLKTVGMTYAFVSTNERVESFVDFVMNIMPLQRS